MLHVALPVLPVKTVLLNLSEGHSYSMSILCVNDVCCYLSWWVTGVAFTAAASRWWSALGAAKVTIGWLEITIVISRPASGVVNATSSSWSFTWSVHILSNFNISTELKQCSFVPQYVTRACSTSFSTHSFFAMQDNQNSAEQVWVIPCIWHWCPSSSQSWRSLLS